MTWLYGPFCPGTWDGILPLNQAAASAIKPLHASTLVQKKTPSRVRFQQEVKQINVVEKEPDDLPKADAGPRKASGYFRNVRPAGPEDVRPGYQRPKRPTINCNECNEHPKGFRGEHELRRHKDLKHSSEYKRFVCRTPAQLGLTSDLQPIIPLENCRHCAANKEYGQYYNAAAHLRRAHFKEKPPRVSRSKRADTKEEPHPKTLRAGMGGGDWPPLAELKAKWMEEIRSTKPVQDAVDVSDDEAHQDLKMISAQDNGISSIAGDEVWSYNRDLGTLILPGEPPLDFGSSTTASESNCSSRPGSSGSNGGNRWIKWDMLTPYEPYDHGNEATEPASTGAIVVNDDSLVAEHGGGQLSFRPHFVL